MALSSEAKAKRLCWQGGLLCVLLTGEALAQDAKDKTPALEEIIVTAERRASALQETPISLATFGNREMEVEGITNLPQAERAVVWGESRSYGVDISWRY